MKYDNIYIGASISNLLSVYFSHKNSLIIEKDSYLGGAWRINSDKLKNIDLVGHLIVPENDIKGKEIINFFNKFNINLKKIKLNDFYYDTDNWRLNGKQGHPIICNNGWVDFNNQIIELVKNKKNIKIITDCKVLKILVEKNINRIFTDKQNYDCNKVFFPTYCNLNKLYYNNLYIEIPYEKIINIHIILKIETTNFKLNKDYQGFFDKKPVGVFDRITICKIEHDTVFLSCRLSKNFKDKDNINILFLPFLVEKDIVKKNSKIVDIFYYYYDCSYRNIENREKLKNNISKINKYFNFEKIIFLDTTYMGHFLGNLINDNRFH